MRCLRIGLLALLATLLVACGGESSDLKAELAELGRELKPRIEPFPPVPPEEQFVLDPAVLKDPFRPQGAGRVPAAARARR